MGRGKYTSDGRAQRKFLKSLCNAIDVGDPSNFSRILELFKGDHQEIKKSISSTSITNEETVATMQETYSLNRYILDPHSAVAHKA